MPERVVSVPGAPKTEAPAVPAAAPGAAAAESHPSPGIILAFDFGRRRIGVACGDSVSRTATPLRALAAAAPELRWDAIDALVREWRPSRVIVGLPYNVDGSESAVAGAARRFARDLGARYAVPVQLVDERYSSLEAEMRLKEARESGLRKRRVTKADVDSAAACIILERWFSTIT